VILCKAITPKLLSLFNKSALVAREEQILAFIHPFVEHSSKNNLVDPYRSVDERWEPI
jgi:hypothetical protein